MRRGSFDRISTNTQTYSSIILYTESNLLSVPHFLSTVSVRGGNTAQGGQCGQPHAASSLPPKHHVGRNCDLHEENCGSTRMDRPRQRRRLLLGHPTRRKATNESWTPAFLEGNAAKVTPYGSIWPLNPVRRNEMRTWRTLNAIYASAAAAHSPNASTLGSKRRHAQTLHRHLAVRILDEVMHCSVPCVALPVL